MAFYGSQTPWFDYVNIFDPVGLGVDHVHTRPARGFRLNHPGRGGLWEPEVRERHRQAHDAARDCIRNACERQRAAQLAHEGRLHEFEDRRRAREEYRRNVMGQRYACDSDGQQPPCDSAPGASAGQDQPAGAAGASAAGPRPHCRARRCGPSQRRHYTWTNEATESANNPFDGFFDAMRFIAADPLVEVIRNVFNPEAAGSGAPATARAQADSDSKGQRPASPASQASMNATVEDAPDSGETDAANGATSGPSSRSKGKQPAEEGNGVDAPADDSVPQTTQDAAAAKSSSDDADVSADNAEAEAATNEPTFTPPLDLFDTEDAWILHLAVPGAQKGDVSVDWDAERDLLTIAGVVHRPGDEHFIQSLARAERRIGLFRRTLTLPPTDGALPPSSPQAERSDRVEVDGDAITARMDNGLLIITVPKAEREWTEIRSVDVL